MPLYTYTARTKDGSQVSGEMEGATASDLRTILRRNEIFLINAQAAEDLFQVKRASALGGRPSTSEIVVFSKLLALMVQAGVPIVSALRVLADQTKNPRLSTAVNKVRLDVIRGLRLSDAMSLHPQIFGEMQVAM